MNTLAEVKEFLENDIPYINRGGCAISALAMYRWLQGMNLLSSDTHFVYMYQHRYGDFQKNEERFNNGTGRMSSCAHAVLFHEGSYHDSNGLHSKSDFENRGFYHFHEMRKEKLVLESINNTDSNCWNTTFERHFVGDIQSKLNINLTDVEGW